MILVVADKNGEELITKPNGAIECTIGVFDPYHNPVASLAQ